MQLALSPNGLVESFHLTMHALLALNLRAPLAVACSGGADSRALALLAKAWAEEQASELRIFIVDHGLRAESASEAAQTAQWARQHGLDASILTLTMDCDTAIQAQARDARYDALLNACKASKINHLLLGHHADDQVETMLFRLLRGSGAHGLSAMSAKSNRVKRYAFEPLLSIPKIRSKLP